MKSRKDTIAQNQALTELAEFPNFVAWLVFTPEGKSLTGTSHEEKYRVYEAAIDALLEKVVNATADLKAQP